MYIGYGVRCVYTNVRADHGGQEVLAPDPDPDPVQRAIRALEARREYGSEIIITNIL